MKAFSAVFLVLLGLILTHSIFAQLLPRNLNDSVLSKIVGAELFCENDGAMYAIDTELNKERVWLADPGEKEGIELTVHKFKRLSCANCYKILTEVNFLGDSLILKIKTKGKHVKRGLHTKMVVIFRNDMRRYKFKFDCGISPY